MTVGNAPTTHGVEITSRARARRPDRRRSRARARGRPAARAGEARSEVRPLAARATPAVVWLAALALAVLGVLAIFALPSGIYPEMKFPRVVVVAHVGQLAPELVEAQVTRPLEQALAVVPGVRHVRARTIRGAVELSLQLTDDTDPLDRAAARARPRSITSTCRAARPRSSSACCRPTVPVITFNLAAAQGTEADPRRLREVAELHRAPRVRARARRRRRRAAGRPRARGRDRDPTRPSSRRCTSRRRSSRRSSRARTAWSPRATCSTSTRRCPSCSTRRQPISTALRALPIANGPRARCRCPRSPTSSRAPRIPTCSCAARAARPSRSRSRGCPARARRTSCDGDRAAVAGLRAAHALPADVELTPVYDQAELVDDSMASVRDAILIGIALSLLVIALVAARLARRADRRAAGPDHAARHVRGDALARRHAQPDVARRPRGRDRPRRRRRDRRDRGHRAPARGGLDAAASAVELGTDDMFAAGHRHDVHDRRRVRAARRC